jgi:hypothetical protein
VPEIIHGGQRTPLSVKLDYGPWTMVYDFRVGSMSIPTKTTDVYADLAMTTLIGNCFKV